MNIETHYDHVDLARQCLAEANKHGKEHQRRAMRVLNRKRAALRHAQNGTKPANRYADDFKATIGGINCGVAVTFYASEDKSTGWPMQADFRLINEGGYPMEFLEAKMTQRERANIESYIIESQRGRR